MKSKNEIRKETLEKMHLIQGRERDERNALMLERLKNDESVRNAENIMCFVSFRDEIDTHELIKHLISRKKRVFVPVIKKGQMLISELESFSELKPGYYGILEPSDESIRITGPEVLDLVITPGVVFDSLGYRIGYGGGYYDRLFSSAGFRAEKIGICFREQLMEKIKKEPHDMSVDRVISA